MAISNPLQTTSLRRILPKLTLIAFLSFVCLNRYQAAEPEPANATKVDVPAGSRSDSTVSRGDITDLQNLILQQHQAIEELKGKLAQQQALIDKLALERKADAAASPNAGSTVEVASLSATPPQATGTGGAAAQSNVVAKKDDKKAEEKPVPMALSVMGFKFSGDFRLRTDGILRSGNAVSGPVQNVRERYRLRLNVDKDLDPRFSFHLQIGSGPINNGLTFDQDFAATVVRAPIFISEGWADFHPNKKFSVRGGRMEEVFADNYRFIWDDDVRFNGFQQIAKLPINENNSVEFRAAQYILSNPNVGIVATGSPYVGAGYQVGQKVRDANMFDQGIVLNLNTTGTWKHTIVANAEMFRNPNEIQLASTPAGFPVLINPALGLVLSAQVTGTGNATTTPGGAIYTAPDFHIMRVSYRLEHKAVKVGDREMPFWFNVQMSRNFGAGFLQDAVLGAVNFGAVKKFGDWRVLYQYGIKDGNSMVSQFTDDDFGTNSGVNIATHAFRFDIGLAKFLQWQNLVFITDERRGNSPSQLFYVPVQRGTATSYRFQSQFAFVF